jgi:hypothetical protein
MRRLRRPPRWPCHRAETCEGPGYFEIRPTARLCPCLLPRRGEHPACPAVPGLGQLGHTEELETELAAPPLRVLCAVGVEGLVESAVGPAVSLGVASEVHASGPDRPGDGRLPDPRAHRPAVFTESTRPGRASAVSSSPPGVSSPWRSLLRAAPSDGSTGMPPLGVPPAALAVTCAHLEAGSCRPATAGPPRNGSSR